MAERNNYSLQEDHKNSVIHKSGNCEAIVSLVNTEAHMCFCLTFPVCLESGCLANIGGGLIHQHILLRFILTTASHYLTEQTANETHTSKSSLIAYRLPLTDKLMQEILGYALPIIVLLTVPASLSSSSSIRSTNSFSTYKHRKYTNVNQRRQLVRTTITCIEYFLWRYPLNIYLLLFRITESQLLNIL